MYTVHCLAVKPILRNGRTADVFFLYICTRRAARRLGHGADFGASRMVAMCTYSSTYVHTNKTPAVSPFLKNCYRKWGGKVPDKNRSLLKKYFFYVNLMVFLCLTYCSPTLTTKSDFSREACMSFKGATLFLLKGVRV